MKRENGGGGVDQRSAISIFGVPATGRTLYRSSLQNSVLVLRRLLCTCFISFLPGAYSTYRMPRDGKAVLFVLPAVVLVKCMNYSDQRRPLHFSAAGKEQRTNVLGGKAMWPAHQGATSLMGLQPKCPYTKQ